MRVIDLHRFFDYQNGDLYWKVDVAHNVKAGRKAGSDKGRYIQVKLHGAMHLAHRVIWEIHHGQIPDGLQIDHIDGNSLNNKIENLRLATNSQNMANTSASKEKNSRFKGVVWNKTAKKWVARIQSGKIRHQLGYFLSEQEAADAYMKASNDLHGDFSVFSRAV